MRPRKVPPDFVTRERDGQESDPDQRAPRMNSDGGHKKRHASELYDAKGPSIGGSGNGGGRSSGFGGGRGSQSMMLTGGSSSSIRDGDAESDEDMPDRA